MVRGSFFEERALDQLMMVTTSQDLQRFVSGPNGARTHQRDTVAGPHFARIVGVTGVGGFVVAVALLHGLERNFDPARDTVSDYALSPYGWIMRTAFAALGIGALATVESLSFSLEKSVWRHVGCLSLVMAAFGLFLDAGFNTDRPGVAETFDGRMHGDGMFILCLTLPVAAYVFGSHFVRSLGSKRARWLRVTGLAQACAIIWFEFSSVAYRGVTERVAILLGIVTLALLLSSSFSRSVESMQRSQDSVGHPDNDVLGVVA